MSTESRFGSKDPNSMWLRRYVDRAERFVLEPKYLFIIQFLWVLPYLFVSHHFGFFLTVVLAHKLPRTISITFPVSMLHRSTVITSAKADSNGQTRMH